MSDTNDLSDSEIEKINEDSAKAYKSPTSGIVPKMKISKFKCTSCGEIIEAKEAPDHCGKKMEPYFG